VLPGKDEFPEEPGFPEWGQQGDKPVDKPEDTPKSAPHPPLEEEEEEEEEEEKPKEMNRGPPSMANICAPWDESEQQQEAPKTITESSLCENPRSPNSAPAGARANLPKDDGEASATQEPSEDNEKGPDPWEDEKGSGEQGPSENEPGAGGKDDFAAQLKNMEEEWRQKNTAVGR